jgi:hypothetical protein
MSIFGELNKTDDNYGNLSKEALIANLQTELGFAERRTYWAKLAKWADPNTAAIAKSVTETYDKLYKEVQGAWDAIQTDLDNLQELPAAQQFEITKKYAIPKYRAKEEIALSQYPDLSVWLNRFKGGSGAEKSPLS